MNNPEYEGAKMEIVFGDGKQFNTGPEPKRVEPFCGECGGHHEPSGARSDCILYWRRLAIKRLESIEWARTLLCSATPAKMLDEQQSQEWCRGFGKWFAESHEA